MGYFYDWLENRWTAIDHDRKLSCAARRRIERRAALIEDLITEMEEARDGIALLYAGLLARTLAASDEVLIQKYGQRIATIQGDLDGRLL